MRVEPGLLAFTEHRIEKLVAAVRQRQEKRREPVPVPGDGIAPASHIEEVHLGFLARWRIAQAHRHRRRRAPPLRPVGGHIAIEGAPTRAYAALVAQPLM